MKARVFAIGLVATGLAGVSGGVLLGARLLSDPGIHTGLPDPAAGIRAQQHLAELLLRQSGGSGRTGPIVIETAELDAFLAGHVRGRRLTLRGLHIRAEQGSLEVNGRTTVRHLLSEAGWLGEAGSGGLTGWLPTAVLDIELWVGARGRVRVENGQGEFLVEAARIGRQPVSAAWLRRVLAGDARAVLSWRMPRIVERIDAESGRVVIHTRARER